MGLDDLQTLLRFFKALADESRLRILALLSQRECSVEELAEALQLKSPTVSHHLAKLKELGLVSMRPEGNIHLYALNLEALQHLSKDLLTKENMETLVEDVETDAWDRKVLRDFLVGERLKEIPASRKKREVILRWLVGHFAHGSRYPESEVNRMLQRHHEDFATLRRELIGMRLMAREHGVYWRLDAEEATMQATR